MKEFRGKFAGGALDGEIILENDDNSFSSDVAAVADLKVTPAPALLARAASRNTIRSPRLRRRA